MKESDNVQVLNDAYAAFVHGDVSAVMRAFAGDIEWYLPGPKEAPYVGRRRGADAVGQFFGQLAQAVEFTAFEPREYIAQGDRVVVLGHYTGRIRSTGKPFASDWAMAWTLSGGKAAAFQEYTDTEAIGGAFR